MWSSEEEGGQSSDDEVRNILEAILKSSCVLFIYHFWLLLYLKCEPKPLNCIEAGSSGSEHDLTDNDGSSGGSGGHMGGSDGSSSPAPVNLVLRMR